MRLRRLGLVLLSLLLLQIQASFVQVTQGQEVQAPTLQLGLNNVPAEQAMVGSRTATIYTTSIVYLN